MACLTCSTTSRGFLYIGLFAVSRQRRLMREAPARSKTVAIRSRISTKLPPTRRLPLPSLSSASAPFRLSPNALETRLGEGGAVCMVPVGPVVRRSALRVAAHLRSAVVPPAPPPTSTFNRAVISVTSVGTSLGRLSIGALPSSRNSPGSCSCAFFCYSSRGNDALDDLGLGVDDDCSRYAAVAEEALPAGGRRSLRFLICCCRRWCCK